MTTEIKVASAMPRILPHAEPSPPRGMIKVLRHGVAPSLLCALLLWLCYFPVAISWFAWVALVPLLCLARSSLTARWIYLGAWLAGLAFFWPVLQWMRVADFRMYFTWAMLATYCSFYFPVAVFLIRRIDRGTAVPFTVNVACVWIGLEYVRSFLLTGFAWYYLGHALHDLLPFTQIADVTGVYGVSFLVAAVNAWLFALLYQSSVFRRWTGLQDGYRDRWLGPQGVAIFLLLTATVVYGIHRLGENEFVNGPRVALLQGNLDQRLRNEAFDPNKKRENPASKINRHYTQLCALALTKQHDRPDLLVWPETSFPLQWWEIHEKVDPAKIPQEALHAAKIQELVRTMAIAFNGENEPKTNILLGVNAVYVNEQQKNILYNSALFLNAIGNWGPRYDKIHRIPFGEYVPLEWIPFMKDLMPYDFDYSITPGANLTRFQAGEHKFGVLICYEDTDPFIARHYGREEEDGPPVDFLVNISNDGWFDGTSEHEQHLAICRFRAIESRRAVARAVNMGVSAIIDPNGRVLKPNTPESFHFGADEKAPADDQPKEIMNSWQFFDRGAAPQDLPTSEWRLYKKTAGVLAINVPIDKRTSYYALLGDWLPLSCWGIVAAAVILGGWRRTRPLISPA